MLACEAWSGVAAMDFGPADRMALVLPFSFSAGMGVVGWALSSGATLHIFDPRLHSVSELLGWLTEQRITTMHSTPSLMRSLLGVLPAGQVLPDLRIVMTCAEPVASKEVAALREHLSPTASYVNWTGATEVGTLALNRVSAVDVLPAGVIPTGRPVPHKTVQIKKANGAEAAPGESGEVTVVSPYIADGYWRDEKRSAVKFGRTADGVRVYRMGDLGKLSGDGVLELLGRVDYALKIRGYLVEPIEVESALLEIDEVTDAVVMGEKRSATATRLIAYVALPPASRLSPAAIRRQLRKKLPEWMVPTVIMQLDQLPRNARGKVDRSALPKAPEGSQAGFVAPRTPWEIAVAEIWSRALQLDEVGVHDDFVELGGDSLAAEEILTLTARELNLRLPSAALLEAPTVAEFAAFVEHASTAGRTETPGQSATGADLRLADHATVVPLKTTGSKPPVFCFAGAGGLALTFLPLVRRLGEDQPAWGLQEHGLEKRGLPDWSVSRAARRHLRAIRAIQPRGPYVLVGYSFGGLVAYETGQQLRAAGEEVSLLVTLDTALPGSIFKRGASPANQTAELSDTIPAQRGTRPPRPGAERPDGRHRFRLIHRIRHSERPIVKILRNAHRLPLTGLVRFAGTDHYDVFFCKGLIASEYYRIRPWAGGALVFVAKDNEEEFDNRRWRDLLTGTWRIEEVAGDHHSIWREPHVNRIAELLRRELDSVRGPASDPPPAAIRADVSDGGTSAEPNRRM
jgi:thioesterase domain-containing protein/acyl carrier protein